MKRICGILAFSVLAVAGAQAAPVKLTGPQIGKLLSGTVLYGLNKQHPTAQAFKANGATYFTDGTQEKQGGWKVAGDKYCSVWPPSEAWTCFDVLRDGPVVRFVSPKGESNDLSLVK
ncbi:MAG: hypothetical protein KGO53_06435 [Alphaproteobacteria bacterium]|nr:hypothetical protein [Alphaproteobacteria bacterium]